MNLTRDEVIRYSRQIALPEVSGAGQRKLRAARVLVVGAGGLGSPAALYLAAAGVGTIGIADGDLVHLSNLQRQVIHTTAAIGSPKVASAAASLAALNPEVSIETHERIDETNASQIIGRYDVIVDGTDNYASRYLLNDCCVGLGRPLCHGAVLGFEGQATTILPGRPPCYRCIYPERPAEGGMPPSCQEAGVLGTVPGVIGAVQATEALKILLEIGEPLSGRLLLYDALVTEMRTVKVRPDPNCPACGARAGG